MHTEQSRVSRPKMYQEQSPGFFNKRTPNGKDEVIDRGGDDLDNDSLTRID